MNVCDEEDDLLVLEDGGIDVDVDFGRDHDFVDVVNVSFLHVALERVCGGDK